MGASWPGKTSLFNAISGRTGNHNNNTVPLVVMEGDIRFGDHSFKILLLEKSFKIKLHTLHSLIRFMKQALTPREAIYFSARLRLVPNDTSEDDIRSLIKHTLHALMLDQCADTVIGGGLIKGMNQWRTEEKNKYRS